MSTAQIILLVMDYVFLINIIFAVLVIFFERRNPTATLTWLLVLLFMPILGFILYVFLGQDLRKKKLFYLKKEEGRELLPLVEKQDRFLREDRIVFNNPRIKEYKDIIFLHLKIDKALYTQDNSVQIFNNGDQVFAALMESIRKARYFIHIEYYIIRNDSLGKAVIELLSEKAREGVEVKFLYDGMGCMRLPRKFFAPLIRAGGETASFFPPLLPYINLRVNYRNHRKICIIDGEEGYIGGFNIGDEYRGLSNYFGFWRDTHLCIRGSAIDGLELRFILDWRHAAKDDSVASERYFPTRVKEGKTGIQIVSSGPDARWKSVKNGYLKMINKARKSIYIHTPYFVPDDSLLEALKLAALSGVDVRIIIPRKIDHIFIHWASLSYIGELLEAGAKPYYYDNGFLHSKMIVIDRLVSSVGTANFDIRSFQLNFEVNAFIYDEKIGQELHETFLRDLEECTEISIDCYSKRSILVRVRESFSRLLSPIL
jgi:cardiolipin synthase